MSTNVLMPQMGESIAEGTIVRWIKKVGDNVDKDEPLFEISTDKVDAEIPAPGAGVVLDIMVKEGETVPVNSVVAVIGEKGAKVAKGAAAPAAPAQAPSAPAPEAQAVQEPKADAAAPRPTDTSAAPATLDDTRRQKSSPVVRKIAKEHGIDITELNGSGIAGRVTKRDIEAFIEERTAAPAAAAPAPAPAARPTPPPAFQPGENVRIEKMGVIRKKIAEHMVTSIQTSPHVYSAYEVDFGRIDE
ncbi:MAG TPA: biotin/lipoyl-containing protein, partial [Vicinamibacterales bacterium]|nr:biotin/lipoyl-containing protein [Vicinamibacterales bacterium]